jgi:hypothetical protein
LVDVAAVNSSLLAMAMFWANVAGVPSALMSSANSAARQQAAGSQSG